MISISATGFIPEKPVLRTVGQTSKVCEFDVCWSRRTKVGSEWKSVYERVTFFAWDQLAERVAALLDKGNEVTCTGTQETQEWKDRDSQQRRFRVKYALTAWDKKYTPPRNAQEGGGDSSRAHTDSWARPPQQASAQAPEHHEEGGGNWQPSPQERPHPRQQPQRESSYAHRIFDGDPPGPVADYIDM